MALRDLTSREAVIRAIAEYDRVGAEEFLRANHFGPALTYFVVWDGRRYDSKAIAGVAHNYERRDLETLTTDSFTGGEATVAKKLRDLGFEVERAGPGRNPTWARDELILALDLYFDAGMLDDTDPRVTELSDLLNRLPIHSVRPDRDRFRNPNAVSLKLANFGSLDPAYPGAGLSRGGQRDREVWQRFSEDREELHELAASIRAGGADFPLAPEEDEDGVEEGRLLYRRHRARERERGIVARKKKAVGLLGAPLACEACGFDFEATYGVLGSDFIECHHVVPLAESGATKTRLGDLALLCSNCHRMVHRRRPWATVDELRSVLAGS
jgi:5-methylcytosine-specific restriction enzyme A